MKEKCNLCDKIAITVLTINIPADKGIRQLNTYRCAEHINVDYFTARKMIQENVSNKLEALHEKSSNNKNLIANNVACGCFNCLKVFDGDAVVKFIDKNATALCPQCGVDAVIASDAKETVTFAMLTTMHKHYFSY